MVTENKATNATRRTYNRVAPVYDFMEGLVERARYSRWRELLWRKVEGTNILEVGVGTGKNFPYYPEGAEITAIDFSEKITGVRHIDTMNSELRFKLIDALKQAVPQAI